MTTVNEPAANVRARAAARGPEPLAGDATTRGRHRGRAHAQLDARSLALHRLAADKIRREPALFERVRRTLERWHRVVDAGSRPYVEEWQRLADAGIETCLAAAVDDSPRGAALRQCSPFGSVLSNEERFEFFRRWARQMHDEPTGT